MGITEEVRGKLRWEGSAVGGGWDCLVNGDTKFLSSGPERGWYVIASSILVPCARLVLTYVPRHFSGDESFNLAQSKDDRDDVKAETARQFSPAASDRRVKSPL